MGYLAGDIVRIVSTGQQGVVQQVLEPAAGEERYRVFSENGLREYYGDQLDSYQEAVLPRIVSVGEFARIYASKKLSAKAPTTLFSLNTGNIKFIPFQLRPLRRMLADDAHRILIADEVGVGKTIESGLILKELENRTSARSVLVVCPKDLVAKWQSEMRLRFGERFDVLDWKGFKARLRDYDDDGEWPEGTRLIIGLETLRQTDHVEYLESQEFPPKFSLIVDDEAHHVSNRETNSYRVIKLLSDYSDAVVMLSATPLQLGSGDLFALLNILRPDEFYDEGQFKLMIEPNEYINNAIRALRKTKDESWWETAADALDAACNVNQWARTRYQGDKRIAYWRDSLRREKAGLSDEDRIACLRDLEDLHSLSHVINRTKRRDIGAFTVREPITKMVEYNDEEENFYFAVREYEHQIYSALHGTRTARFIMSNIERMITSCLPAFANTLDDVLARGLAALGDAFDDVDFEGGLGLPEDVDLAASALELKRLAKRLPEIDAKTEMLCELVEETVCEGEKLLVFSFYRNTLAHLYKRLTCGAARVAVLTGETRDEDRKAIRGRFRLPSGDPMAIDILLSSEVGCEGLDYEFCSRMVNYDIPWNPMKLEQRIGRIDRFGQKSPKVRIYNFITKGTVEARIFFRCYERLGIFTSTIGDLEEILGTLQEPMEQLALDLSLSDEQEEEKARQISDNAIRMVYEQREVEAASESMFLMDLSRQDGDTVAEKHAQAHLLCRVVESYLSERFESEIQKTGEAELRVKMKLSSKKLLAQEIAALKKRERALRTDECVKVFETLLADKGQIFCLVFNNEDAGDERHLVDNGHPLTKLALDLNGIDGEAICNFAVENAEIDPGKYSYACYEWDERGYRQSDAIKVFIADSCGNVRELDTSAFEELASRGRSLDASQHAEDAIDGYVRQIQVVEKERITALSGDAVQRKLATLEGSYQRKILRAHEELNTATNEKRIRMKEGQIRNLEAELELRRNELHQKSDADILVTRFASGVMEVLP